MFDASIAAPPQGPDTDAVRGVASSSRWRLVAQRAAALPGRCLACLPCVTGRTVDARDASRLPGGNTAPAPGGVAGGAIVSSRRPR
jgi:hypothetical protein